LYFTFGKGLIILALDLFKSFLKLTFDFCKDLVLFFVKELGPFSLCNDGFAVDFLPKDINVP
jgi:hypothetical protein